MTDLPCFPDVFCATGFVPDYLAGLPKLGRLGVAFDPDATGAFDPAASRYNGMSAVFKLIDERSTHGVFIDLLCAISLPRWFGTSFLKASDR